MYAKCFCIQKCVYANKFVYTNFCIQKVFYTNILVCKHICIPGNANLFLEIKPGKGKYTEFYYEIEKSKSSLAIENINISPIEKLDISVVKNLEETEIQIIAESLKNFQNTNIFLHTPFGLPVLSPTNIYSIDQKKINSSFKFSYSRNS